MVQRVTGELQACEVCRQRDTVGCWYQLHHAPERFDGSLELNDSQRRSLLTAALGRWLHESGDRLLPEIRPLARWMDSWTGRGAVIGGMRAHGFDLELKEFPTG